MKNNKGFGKYELITVIVILMVIVAFLLWRFLGDANSEKYNTMKKSATVLSQTITTNFDSFHNTETAYLGEAIREGFISPIKSPFSGNECSSIESKIEMKNAKAMVTLRCDDYLIDGANAGDSYDKIHIYKVSDWSLKKPEGKVEKRVLYNCLDGGTEKYEEYTEELYFVSLINNDYGSDHYDAKSIKNECKVVSKTFYRVKNKIK